MILPGNDAPERVVFSELHGVGWASLHSRVGRNYSDTANACTQAMTSNDHHEWLRNAATKLLLAGDTLWQAMCAEWVLHRVNGNLAAPIVDAIAAVIP
jgi:hypothetical protein